MISTRQRVAALIAATAGLALSAPAAGASATTGAGLPWAAGLPAGGLPGLGALPSGGGVCGTQTTEGQGAVAGTESKICLGAGLVFVGPAVGQIATVIGPTIMGPAVIGTSVVSAGNVAAG
jgi:hypothetical protein